MSSFNWIHWSGMALAVGGLGVALFLVTLIPLGGFNADAPTALTSTYLLAHSFHSIGALLLVFGLAGLYATHRAKAGLLGLIGFLLAMFGTIMFFIGGLIAAIVVPAQAAQSSASVTPTPLAFILVTFLPFLFGYIFLGVTVIRARVLWRWGGLLLIVGAALFALPTPWPVPVIGALALGVGLFGLGWAIWSGTSK